MNHAIDNRPHQTARHPLSANLRASRETVRVLRVHTSIRTGGGAGGSGEGGGVGVAVSPPALPDRR